MTNHPSLNPTLGRSNVATLIASINSADAVPPADLELDELEPLAAYRTGYVHARADAIGEIALMWHAAQIATAAVNAELERDLAAILAGETDAEADAPGAEPDAEGDR